MEKTTYNPALDKTLSSKEKMFGDKIKLTVATKQYDGGQVKFDIARSVKTYKGDFKPINLGRITGEEALFVNEFMSAVFGK